MLQTLKRTSSAKSDLVGISASFLCVVHCLAFPVLLSTGHIVNYSPSAHWHGLDYIFILMGILAVGISSQRTSFPAVKIAFWSAIFLFSVSILFHDVWIGMVYISVTSSLILIVLHIIHWQFYRKYAL